MSLKITLSRAKHYLLPILLIPVLIVLLLLIFSIPHRLQRNQDMKRLSSEKYEAVFCTMFSTGNFNESDFTDYRGIPTVMSDCPSESAGEVASYIERAISSGNYVHHIYLGLDPEKLRSSSLHSNRLMQASLKKYLLPIIETHPEITFEVLFPAPSMDYWANKEETDITKVLAAYSITASALTQYGNVSLYYAGAEDWLIKNSANYDRDADENGTLLTEEMARHLLLLTFCDGKYRLDRESITPYFQGVNLKILTDKAKPAVYPDLSDLCIVFLGDSIIGNFSGSLSVPGATAALSGATTYNLAVGGTPAVLGDADDDLSFLRVLDYLIQGNEDALPTDHFYREKLEEYRLRDTSKRLCFVINYGLNDYFGGCRVADPADPYNTNTYAGALRTGLTRLKEAYPEAEIILATPNFVSVFENGSQLTSDVGSVLTDYVDAALTVAEECDVLCLDNYHDLGVNAETAEEYLQDMCHLSDSGRYLYAVKLVKFIEGHQ